MSEKRKSFVRGMAAGLVFAFAILWLVAPADRQARPEPAAESDLAHFFNAVEQGDFDGMRSAGTRIFTPGAAIPGIAARLAPYEVNGFPPYRVYAFMTENDATATRRVLLTMNDQDRVESFLAEEMPLAP